MIRFLLLTSVLAGCTSEPSDEVTGPFTGEPRRYVVDSFTLPLNNTMARELARDIDGDDVVDNQLGMVISTLAQQNNITKHAADMIASGAIHSTVYIQADDLLDDPTVGVTYHGSDGDDATAVGGRFEDGVFVSNRTATTSALGDAIARLPVFVDADPSDVPVVGLQIELVPDGAGYLAYVSGGVDAEVALEQTWQGIVQLIEARPEDHRSMLSLFDTNKDYAVSFDELRTNNLMKSLFAPDAEVRDREVLSIGFAMHLTPCESGSCVTPAASCFDRVQNGNESDIDCGGDCRSCKGDEACTFASDCETAACDGGTCRAPSCSDGIRDGFETDVDCGGPCGDCATGARCWSNGDCASGQCGEPCTDPDPFNCVEWTNTYETCRPVP